MNNRMISGLAISTVILLSGCHARTADNPSGPADPMVYRDHMTGCDYLSRGNGQGGLTPRTDASGKQVCKAAQP